jgi:hypothetical protein
MRIAITGHRGLPADTERLVDRAIRQQLGAYAGRYLVGVTNLADEPTSSSPRPCWTRAGSSKSSSRQPVTSRPATTQRAAMSGKT